MPPRLSDTKRATILQTIKQGGLSTRQVAKLHDVSEGTVRNIAKEAELPDPFTRAHTENATRARTADNKARRAALSALLLDDVERLRERAWTRYQHPMASVHGPEILDLDLPPLGEVRSAYTAIGICLDKHIVLQRHDADAGAGQAASMLAGLSDALGAAARALDADDGPAAGD